MTTTTEFCEADRYVYDFGLCSFKNGFARVDTSQDASYFGTWTNPAKLIIFTYCEGDCILQATDDPAKYEAELRKIKKWNIDNGHTFSGIDTACDAELEQQFRRLGMADLFHGGQE